VELSSEARQGLCPRCLFLDLATAPEAMEDAPPGLGPEAECVLRHFGDYDLLEEVGRGGMGVVYKAWQRSLKRLVAIKMLAPGVEPNPEFIQRLRSEASAAACLNHPHIVAIHEVGMHEKQHYFAMDLIAGPSLARVAGNQPLPTRKAAEYMGQICAAVHHAHEHGILHRDLKPSNILIDPEDQPHVTDFGLARRLAEDTQVTLTGQVLGSPLTCPPSNWKDGGAS
jgi:eukaryotic-like serine/threonine-protein kinase